MPEDLILQRLERNAGGGYSVAFTKNGLGEVSVAVPAGTPEGDVLRVAREELARREAEPARDSSPDRGRDPDLATASPSDDEDDGA